MRTIKEYVAKMGKMPTMEYRFQCGICEFNGNIKALQNPPFKPKLMMRAYLGRGGIQFFNPDSYPKELEDDLQRLIVAKCKALIRLYEQGDTGVRVDYLLSSTTTNYEPSSSVDNQVRSEIVYDRQES